jgi:hypothetical protein
VRTLHRAAVPALLVVSSLLLLVAEVQRWWPDCRVGHFDDGACLVAQSYPYGRYGDAEPWMPVAHTAQLEGLSLMALAAAVALLPWLWLPRRVAVSLTALLPAFCIALLGLGLWTAGPSGSPSAAADAGGAPTTALVWVFGLPAALAAAAVVRLAQAPARTLGWRVAVAVLVGLSNPLAAYFIAPIFTGYVSHDEAPWTGLVSVVLLLVAAACMGPSSRGTLDKRSVRTAPDASAHVGPGLLEYPHVRGLQRDDGAPEPLSGTGAP